MTVIQRAVKIIGALLTAGVAATILRLGENGFLLASVLLNASLILFGLRNILYYFRMARHTVDGRTILYIGVIALNLGVLTISVTEHQGAYVVAYLLGAYAFSGVLDILRAREARSFESPAWKWNLAEGIANIAFASVAVVFGFFLGNMWGLTVIYSIGLFYSAFLKLISSFRNTAIIYIQ